MRRNLILKSSKVITKRMNRVIINGGVILGIAVLLSMNVLPVQADPPQNVCNDHRTQSGGAIWQCAQDLEIGQHVAVNSKIQDSRPHCHYEVAGFFNGRILEYEHGSTNNFECPNLIVIVDPHVGRG